MTIYINSQTRKPTEDFDPRVQPRTQPEVLRVWVRVSTLPEIWLILYLVQK